MPWTPRINNFGDLLGPAIVDEILRRNDIVPGGRGLRPAKRLLAVGSIMRMAQDGDVIWGPGINGKSIHLGLDASKLDIRAVRGPLTAKHLRGLGHRVPDIHGDPGLLVGKFWKRADLAHHSEPVDVLVVPNLNDLAPALDDTQHKVLDPRSPLNECLSAIAASNFVVGSSLHAIVVAESLGIPARLISSGTEPPFKYDDYYGGTGRMKYRAATDLAEAIAMGGERPPIWDERPLLEAFPFDLWGTQRPQTVEGTFGSPGFVA